MCIFFFLVTISINFYVLETFLGVYDDMNFLLISYMQAFNIPSLVIYDLGLSIWACGFPWDRQQFSRCAGGFFCFDTTSDLYEVHTQKGDSTLGIESKQRWSLTPPSKRKHATPMVIKTDRPQLASGQSHKYV